MRDLVLHVGLPKTATTALRRHVYSGLPGYLGSLSSMQHRDEEVRTIQLAYAAFANNGVSDGTHSLRTALTEWVADLPRPIAQPTILVNHRLSEWAFSADLKQPARIVSDAVALVGRTPRVNPLPPFLEALRETLPDDIRLRAIVSLRRQPEWLASLYAQSARTMRRPGQDDFESKMQRIMRDDDPRLDFAALVTGLHDALGPSNVLPLLFEDGLENHAAAVARFLKLPSLETARDKAPENVRQTDGQTWRLNHTSNVRFSMVRRVVRSEPIPGIVRHPTLSATMRIERAASVAARRFREARWGRTVVLQPETRRMLLDHCQPYNRRLSAAIGRDLVPHGYIIA